jgi:hypothetical protein
MEAVLSLAGANATSVLEANVADVEAEAEWSFDVAFEFVVHGILINSVGVLGLLGNVVSIVVLSRPQVI